jgi:hypothetical protein
LTAALGGGTACTTVLGYDSVGFDGGDGSGGTKSGPIDPMCIPGGGAATLASSCGAFVSAARGDDAGGKGTPDSPYRTLARALSQNKVVYACNEAAFDEALTIEGEITIFGGLDCVQGWAYAPGKRSTFRAPSDQVPVLLQQDATLVLRDVAVAAADASLPGGSSIAVIASQDSVLDAQRCSFTAGAGRDGAAPAAAIGNAKDGTPGQKGNAGCTGWTPATEPGLGGQLQCDDVDVSGGGGGSGFNTGSGADGSDGLPQSGKEDGHGGKKEDASACTAGNPGAAGDTGDAGAGAKGLGAISHDGFTGEDGADGAAGKPGQGAGGGGGARVCLNAKAGPSGGGGGSGGCGGKGGRGGRAGGASIGVVSLNAKLALSDVLITAGRGGLGSDGAPGSTGGKGGLGGAQGLGDNQSKACAGGKGGDGGSGGRGGGGRGGHSIGIAHIGPLTPPAGVEIQISVPGDGGHGDGPGGDGAPGAAEKIQSMD